MRKTSATPANSSRSRSPLTRRQRLILEKQNQLDAVMKEILESLAEVANDPILTIVTGSDHVLLLEWFNKRVSRLSKSSRGRIRLKKEQERRGIE